MEAPLIPKNEELRLESLYKLNILDTGAEERFDRVTRLAKRLFSVPIALVSIVDSKRQWFKSKQGLEATETPREISFCGHAIFKDTTLIIENALNDKRFEDNPLVLGAPEIRFYAGQPIKSPDKYAIGTLCIIDSNPRKLNYEDINLLEDLSSMIEDEIANLLLSSTDELTKLSNRRGFNQLGQHSLNLCQRLNKPLCLFTMDLNDFKLINDTYGHDAGDDALRCFSTILLDTFRKSDVIARTGGDEFIVLTSNVTPEETSVIQQRLQDAIDQYNQISGKPYQLRYSIGLTYMKPGIQELSLNDLMKQADQNMYIHKKTLKNFR
ncbi:sensor domain-containing diguanylate cyclase (plasmid) [Legionella sp. D16C41]|uniref:sensor domain-containing diguanylate cyclase n=1 Tax=Legionella sp. D16C41 TaxID=3402688 RepID=UPI003AF9AE06